MITCEFNTRHHYQIYFNKNFLALDSQELADYIKTRGHRPETKLLVLIDQNVSQLNPSLEKSLEVYLGHFKISLKQLPFVILPAGEESKNNLDLVLSVYQKIKDLEIDRHSYILSIGGGSTNDLAGLIANTAHRGIRHIRIPTTVLAQNDAAIGVKNGINFRGAKNFIGTFGVPDLVINSSDFLKTLPYADFVSGYAEALKIALIKSPGFFQWIEENTEKLTNKNEEAVSHLIFETARLHTDHFQNSGDPFEKGSSRPLDYGHWIAHKLEGLSHFELKHGEAVGLGMALDTLYAKRLNWIKSETSDQVLFLIKRLGLLDKKEYLEKLSPEILNLAMEDFQTHLGGKLSIPLLTDIGMFKNADTICTKTYLALIESLNAY